MIKIIFSSNNPVSSFSHSRYSLTCFSYVMILILNVSYMLSSSVIMNINYCMFMRIKLIKHHYIYMI